MRWVPTTPSACGAPGTVINTAETVVKAARSPGGSGRRKGKLERSIVDKLSNTSKYMVDLLLPPSWRLGRWQEQDFLPVPNVTNICVWAANGAFCNQRERTALLKMEGVD